jgi:hypothetical protein
MHAKQIKRSNRNPLKRSVIPSIKKVYTFYVEPTRGEREEPPRLPKFKPIKLSEVLRTKTGKSALNINSDVTIELILRVDEQQVKLLRALDLDENNPDWAQAFLQLAKIHHGVGIVHVEKARAPNKHAVKWTNEQDNALFAAINPRLQKGKTATAAFKEIAGDKAIWEQFPTVKNSRSQKSPAALRVQTYRKRWGLVKKTRLLDSVQSAILDGLLTQPPATKQKNS